MVVKRNALPISNTEAKNGGTTASHHIPMQLIAPYLSIHEEFHATGVTSKGSRAQPQHVEIKKTQRVMDVGPYGG